MSHAGRHVRNLRSRMENENSRQRPHPYRSPGRVNLRITHNFFSFSNNTASLFPQQQHQPQIPQQGNHQRHNNNVMKPVGVQRAPSSSSITSIASSEGSNASRRQPFQDLSTTSNRFIKLPSSCKIAESSVTLVSNENERSVVPSQKKEYQQLYQNVGKKIEEAMDTEAGGSTPAMEYKPLRNLTRSSPTFQPDYCFDILSNWCGMQHRARPRKYMDKQKEISHKMRSILIDWIVEVTIEFESCQDTLFLTASIIDRFLSKMNVPKSKLQLIGTAALFISCKYEETSPPGIKDFVYITDDTYSKEQILRMEQIILQALNFDLMPPTSYDFVKAYCSLLQLPSQVTCLAIYLAELTLIDGDRYTSILPSLIATSAVALARLTNRGPFWDDSLCALSPHVRSDVQRCADCLYTSFYEAALGSHKAVFEKFKSESYGCVSLTNLPVKLPWN